MTVTLISNMQPYTFGQMTNRMIGNLISGNTQMARLKDAIATASSGFEGTDGTQFETGPVQNLFGVIADMNNPGAQGLNYQYAIEQLAVAWETFWTAAQPYIEQLDNGQQGM
jgi:hypothetical protein